MLTPQLAHHMSMWIGTMNSHEKHGQSRPNAVSLKQKNRQNPLTGLLNQVILAGYCSILG